jgi:hypothetical protein
MSVRFCFAVSIVAGICFMRATISRCRTSENGGGGNNRMKTDPSV